MCLHQEVYIYIYKHRYIQDQCGLCRCLKLWLFGSFLLWLRLAFDAQFKETRYKKLLPYYNVL